MSSKKARSGSLQTGWKIAGLALFVLLAFGPSIVGPLHFDSKAAIVREAQRDSAIERLTRRPTRALTTTTFLVSERLFGFHPRPWRLTNLALHGLVVGLLVTLAQELGVEAIAALVGGLLFAVHPLAGSAVLPVVQRSEMLCAAFLLLMLIAWLRARSLTDSDATSTDSATSGRALTRRRRVCLGLAGVAGWLALVSKEVGAVAPLLILILELTRARTEGEPWIRRGAQMAIGAGVLIVIAIVVALDVPARVLGDPTRAGLYWLTQGRSLIWLLSRAVWPVGLSVDPGGHLATGILDPGWLGHLAIFGGLGALARWGDRRTFALAAMAFVLTWPSSSIIPLPDPCFEHRAYLSLGLLIIAGAGAIEARLAGAWRSRALMAAILLILTLAGLSNLRSRAWRSELALWWRAAERGRAADAPPRALVSLGVIVLREGLWRVGPAAAPVPARDLEGELRTCPEVAGEARPLSSDARSSALGPTEHARRLFDLALAAEPNDLEASRALVNRSLCHVAASEAARALIPGLQGRLKSLAARGELESAEGARLVGELEATASTITAALEAAEADLLAALERRPDAILAYNNLGRLRLRTGRVEAAEAAFREALKLDPRSGEASVGLGDVLRSRGRTDEAAACYQAALPRLSGRRQVAVERRLKELRGGSGR